MIVTVQVAGNSNSAQLPRTNLAGSLSQLSIASLAGLTAFSFMLGQEEKVLVYSPIKAVIGGDNQQRTSSQAVFFVGRHHLLRQTANQLGSVLHRSLLVSIIPLFFQFQYKRRKAVWLARLINSKTPLTETFLYTSLAS